MMYEMKGVAETVMVGHSAARGRVELARYADGSWAIRKSGAMIGVWERDERGECLRVFNMLVGVGVRGERRASEVESNGDGGAWN
jgi:hypothetical protein